MTSHLDEKIDLESMTEALRKVEALLNQIILSNTLTKDEMKDAARLCLKAVDTYTDLANQNIGLLKEETQAMWDKLKLALEGTSKQLIDENDIPETEIN